MVKVKLNEREYKLLKMRLENDIEELRYSVKTEFHDLKRGISKGDFNLAITSCENLIESLKEIEVKEKILESLKEMVIEE